MRANAQLSLLAEKLFPGLSYGEQLALPSVDTCARQAEARVYEESELYREALSEEARAEMRQSLMETLSWMLLFRVPGELVQSTVDAWVPAQREMLRRIVADRGEIEARFGRDAGLVRSLDLDLSDRHSGGRTVAAITFDSGLRLIYKPRDIGIEAWFSGFLSKLNELGAPLPFRLLEILSREEYGWTEFATHRRCRDENQLAQFYGNAGALLCVLHLLHATDCHFENLIANGEWPFFVDAETLFQPSLAQGGEAISVLRTGMLPRPALHSPADISPADFGALSCVMPQSVPVPIPALNGAANRLESAVLTPETNVPFPAAHDLSPQDYADEMIDGFSRTWEFLAAHRDEVLTAFDSAGSLHVRYVFRDTLSYYQSLVAGLCLGGSPEGLKLAALTGAKAVFAPLEERERLALQRLDIPRFVLRAKDRSLSGVADCFPVSGFELARTAIERMSDKEMEKQIGVLRVCWGFYAAAKTLAGITAG
jgi:type 2 lantibiotic biosynthesis protein LanM